MKLLWAKIFLLVLFTQMGTAYTWINCVTKDTDSIDQMPMIGAGCETHWCLTTRRQNHLSPAAVHIGKNHVLSMETSLLGETVNIVMRSHHLMYHVRWRMFCCVKTTALQHQTFGV